MKRLAAGAVVSLIAAGLTVGGVALPAVADAAGESAVNAECKLVDVVFARGSGQWVGNSDEANTFRDSFRGGLKALTGGEDFNYYELGLGEIDGNSYPAVSVGFDWFGESTWNSVGAKISSGGSWSDYGKSVDEGVAELTSYIQQRVAKCGSNTRIVLGGYSQGAQVVGETYVEKLTDVERNAVVYNALFGDPKLYLPEGESGWHRQSSGDWFNKYYALACSGDENGSAESYYSEWREEVPDCNTDDGSLGHRIPYLPAGFTDKTGLWCLDDDFVCGSDPRPGHVDGHMQYATGWTKQGAQKALEALASRIEGETPISTDDLRVYFLPARAGTTGLDVVFLVDSTGSMYDTIDSAKAFAASLSSKIEALNGRVALVEYRDQGDEFAARVLSGLQEDVSDFQTKLDGIGVDGGGDTPEAALHALTVAMDGVDWRPGATKAAVVLTDAGFHNPDAVDGETIESVAAKSLTIDPVNVYPVVPSYEVDEYRELAEKTSGQVIENSAGAAEALDEALTKIATRPVVQLPLNAYYADPDQTVTFDASSSYSVDSTIVRWDWDFDGDGVFEVQDGSAVEKTSYPTVGDYNVQVRATDENGGLANHSVPVHIGTTTDIIETPRPADSINVTENGDTSADVTWTATAEPTDGGWVVSIDDVPVGKVKSPADSVTLTDLDRSQTLTISVAPLTGDGVLGTAISTDLKAQGIPDVPATVTLDKTVLRPGETLEGTGQGFGVSESVEVIIDTETTATATTDESGNLKFQTLLPDDITTGNHQLTLRSATGQAVADFQVEQLPAAPSDSSATPQDNSTDSNNSDDATDSNENGTLNLAGTGLTNGLLILVLILVLSGGIALTVVAVARRK